MTAITELGHLDDRPVDAGELLAPYPPPPTVSATEVAAAVAASGRRLVVLDDDPTGTQTVADIPVLTTWGVDDLQWGLAQEGPGLFVLTNSRSLSPDQAAARNDDVIEALATAGRAVGRAWAVASRSDSTLRGHFQVETEGLAASIATRSGTPVDGVIVAPAYIEGGRITVDSVHRVRTPEGYRPAATSEFARDATFGYHSSDLMAYVEEKTGGRWPASQVARITLHDLRTGGRPTVAAILAGLRDGRPVVVDAACDEDLRVLALALLDAEAGGRHFLYRVGPSFVRARLGLEARPPLTGERIARLRRGHAPAAPHGLVVVGSHVGLTSRQLDRLRTLDGLAEVTLDVPSLLVSEQRDAVVAAAVDAVLAALADHDVIVSTSRRLVTGVDGDASLRIARTVSAAVVDVVADTVDQARPAWIVAKGGITSSDVATAGLGITRAWARGTLLPGIVSLWEPETSRAPGLPYVVFAGNVGDDQSLAAAVTILRSSTGADRA